MKLHVSTQETTLKVLIPLGLVLGVIAFCASVYLAGIAAIAYVVTTVWKAVVG